MATLTKDTMDLSNKTVEDSQETKNDKEPNSIKIFVVSHCGYIM
jgi:hypothetical protein